LTRPGHPNYNRHMRLYFAFIVLALLVAALSGVGLAWDGGFTLYSILDSQSPQISYDRFTQIPLHWLLVQLSHVTSDLNILRTSFGLGYALLSLLALAASWWIVRTSEDRRPLFIWAALGIGLGTLPGQVCVVCQAMTSVQLFYPIFLSILIRMPRRSIPVVAAFVIAIFFLHPSAIPLFALAAGVALLVALRYPEVGRKMLWWVLAFALASAISLLRFALIESPYESGELSLAVLYARFFQALAGLPIVALAFAWTSAVMILIQPYLEASPARRDRSFCVSLACIIAAGLLLTLWAIDPRRWAQEVGFREWALFVSLPIILIATAEALLGRVGTLSARGYLRRMRLVQLTGLIFFVVVSIQSITWLNLTNRLREQMTSSSSPCISASSLAWLRASPLDHWSLTSYSLLVQGRSPEKVVMAESGCSDESFLNGLLVAQFGPGNWNVRNWNQGWFDLHSLGERLAVLEQTPPSCTFPLTQGWYGIERSGSDWHRWTRGRAGIRVLLDADANAILRGDLVSIQQPNAVDILLNGKPAATLVIARAGWQPFGPVHLAIAQGTNWIEFVSRNPPIQIPTDTRWLAIALMNPSLTLDDGVTICR
jgi:hypothetical protein